MKTFIFDNFVCRLGQSAKENWSLLDNAREHHIFLHLRSFPSGYVIIEYEKDHTSFMIYTAAEICKDNSKYKSLRDVKVDWCKCGNLEKTDKIGEVYFKSNRLVKQIKV